MFWFVAIASRGLEGCDLLEIPKAFFIILHILFHMLEIKVYSIIVSKVFGVTIAINFLFAIVK